MEIDNDIIIFYNQYYLVFTREWLLQLLVLANFRVAFFKISIGKCFVLISTFQVYIHKFELFLRNQTFVVFIFLSF